MKIFIGGLPADVTSEDLAGFFVNNGVVVSSPEVVRDHFTGRSRRFSIVEVSDATAAARICNGKLIKGFPVVAKAI